MRLLSAISSSFQSSALGNVMSPCGAVARGAEALRAGVAASEVASPFYKRLARLLESTSLGEGSPGDVLWRIECFAHVSSWLKVAGDAKAEVLTSTLDCRPPLDRECTLELGAFVGYSAIRLSRHICAWAGRRGVTGTSLEIDPVHAAVSRHHLDQARLSSGAEIWLGQLQDTMPRANEEFGAQGLAFTFMDQRGTTFHSDLAELEALQACAPTSHTVADNTVKPGAPVFLWHVAIGATHSWKTGLVAMSEFASEAIEDWQSVSLLKRGTRVPNTCESV